MPKVLVNGINFHYWRVGEGPDIVMLHGLSGNLAVWHLEMVPMLRKNFRITTYDLRGHGHTDISPTGYTTRDMAEDLLGILDALKIERAILVGHSLGADISLHIALLYPERVEKIVLIEAGIPALANIRKREDWKGWEYWAKAIEEFTGIQVPREKWSDIDYMLRLSLKVPILYGPARGLPRKENGLRKLLDTTLVKDYEVVGEMTLENLPKIPHPKLLVYDATSPYIGTFHVLRDLLVNCTPILLPSSEHRHFSPLEMPEFLVKHIKSFLNSDEKRASSVSESKQM